MERCAIYAPEAAGAVRGIADSAGPGAFAVWLPRAFEVMTPLRLTRNAAVASFGYRVE